MGLVPALRTMRTGAGLDLDENLSRLRSRERRISTHGHYSEGLERALVVAEYERHGHRLRFSASA